MLINHDYNKLNKKNLINILSTNPNAIIKMLYIWKLKKKKLD